MFWKRRAAGGEDADDGDAEHEATFWDGDAAAAAAPLLPLDRERIFLQGFLGDHKRRLKTLVESHGGAVVDRAASPTLAILPDNHTRYCRGEISHLQPRYRIVRERWLLRVSAAGPLPDFKPDAVFAQWSDVRDQGSYFYGAVPLDQKWTQGWKAIPEDWTPSPAASATWRFDCLCGVSGTNYDDGLAMWECSTCNTWQHAACAGGAEDAVCPEDYTCSRCRSQEAEAA